MGILSALFGKSNAKPVAMQSDRDPRYGATPQDVAGLSGSPLESPNGKFGYHFNPVPIPRAVDPAYRSALLQFQEYPETVVEGWGGIAYKRGFNPFQPPMPSVNQTPVIAGTSGIIHDTIYSQPLADTSGNTVAG